jgi:hypothetical protein
MASDTQGVNSGSSKLVTQPKLPSNAASSMPSEFNGVIQAPKPSGTTTNRDSMRLIDQKPLPKGGKK